ncbi:M64 family metallopeptidase, partial [Klebsiella aerogenes]|nr:M64 family metallopeptidase [Klebsiella aerogenes]
MWVDTYFDATYCTDGIERLLTVNTDLVRETFRDQRIAFHDAIVLVNCTDYGGSGEAQIAVCSNHSDALNIA